MLLKEAHIPFVLVDQDANEHECDWGLPLQQVVTSIALHKMSHVVMPKGQENDVAFVLTADTLSQDSSGALQGKPVDEADAYEKIKVARNGTRLCTAFCLDKKMFLQGNWETVERIEKQVFSSFTFNVPDEWISTYLEKSYAENTSGAIMIELFGNQFLESINGSYSTIIGLPMMELRESLSQLGFFA